MMLNDIVAEAIPRKLGGVPIPRERIAAAVLARLAPLLRAAHWAVEVELYDCARFGVPPDLLAALDAWSEGQ